MDRIVERFFAGVAEILGADQWSLLASLVPSEMQGFGGLLRGAFTANVATAVSVRLAVEPWSTDERWEAMVRGRELGERAFWPWLADGGLCRIPYVTRQFESQCSQCGEGPCVHGAALTFHWLNRVLERPALLLLLLNRRGLNRYTNPNAQPIARVPAVLGTNLDRTKKELLAIIEAAQKAAGAERDNLFGGGDEAAYHGDRP